ncbi:hypothetical protein [Paraburkholderia sp. C35]|uniref:hypothetical protein n=1 Tax=Paraburkholderia sp. C35 TaxID=2126993 RepID=UPI001EF59BEC|nr:hypothetical protein [Paraburkholderia sp. C35]
MMNRFFRCIATAGITLASVQAAWAQTPAQLQFDTHAAFFSAETPLASPLDPQVFVADAGAPAAVGPQGIAHVAGVRNARLSDAPATPLYDAQDRPLHFTLQRWLGATGTVTLTPAAQGHETVGIDLTGLVPNGLYSAFENHFDQSPIGFTPLDGAGTANTFRADATGHAHVSVDSPNVLTHDNAVLIVYHADGRAWGTERGALGVAAQHQLIARLP